MRDFDDRDFDRQFTVGFWVAMVVWVAFLVVVGWAIVRVVEHFT